MPYIFEVVNVTSYIWLYINIDVLDYSTWNSNHLMHPMCEYIYAHVYMSMHSLHWCDISQISGAYDYFSFWSHRKTFTVRWTTFLFFSEQHAFAVANAYRFPSRSSFVSSSNPLPKWISVENASSEYCLIFDNHFLFSGTLIPNSVWTAIQSN